MRGIESDPYLGIEIQLLDRRLEERAARRRLQLEENTRMKPMLLRDVGQRDDVAAAAVERIVVVDQVHGKGLGPPARSGDVVESKFDLRITLPNRVELRRDGAMGV